MHNSAVEPVAVDNHLTRRNGVFLYVRRVPNDLEAAFAFARVQQSLRTRDQREARRAALDLDREWDARFAAARAARGLETTDFKISPVETAHWQWPDWQALADWIGATLKENDWQARLGNISGKDLISAGNASAIPWREDEVVRAHIDLARLLPAMTVAAYSEERSGFLQNVVRPLGITLSKTSRYWHRFMAACLAAELDYLEVFQLREARKGGLGNPHPDEICGPWRQYDRGREAMPAAKIAPVALSGKSLGDCLDQWVADRREAKKSVSANGLQEMRHTIGMFETHVRIRDVAAINAQHLLRFRSSLRAGRQKFAIATINKKLSIISSLIKTAYSHGWIAEGPPSGLALAVPSDEGTREPYTDEHIAKIFAHAIFTSGYRFKRAKAGGELQYWLPLIACTHGMITSEVLQLGPDTIGPHPRAPDILCFTVTNAGGRTIKALARKRYVPVRKELLDLGLRDLVDLAKARNQRFLWPAVEEADSNIPRVSGYFSSFWNSLQKEVGIADDVSLYSFRHLFQDRLGEAGYGEEVKKALMGHADSGMTQRYGTKQRPKSVRIELLNEAIQKLLWPFLER